MRLGARNSLPGKIVAITRGPTSAKVNIGNGIIVTSSITTKAADDLDLTVGNSVCAIVKASDVIIGK